jgi:hypothetical protein
MKKIKPPLRLPVANARHSKCGSAKLKDLDFDRGWWTDGTTTLYGTEICLYLHVYHKDGETIHRVHCRNHKNPRLLMKNGKLYWLVPAPKTPKK